MKLLSSGWTQNFVIALIFALVIPAITYYLLRTPRSVVIAAAIGLTIAIWLLTFALIRNQEEPETATEGTLKPANDPFTVGACPQVPRNAVALHFGNSTSYTTVFPHTVLAIGGKSVLSLDRKNGSLTVSAKILSEDMRIIAELRENRFYINPNNYFRRERPDPHTLVVYDQQGRQVLNVRYMNKRSIKILGSFHSPGRPSIIIQEDHQVIGGLVMSRNCFGNNRVDISIE